MLRLVRVNEVMARLIGVDEFTLLLLEIILLVVIVVFISRLAIVRPRTWRAIGRDLLRCLGWFLVISVLLAFFMPSLAVAPEAARRSHCTNNLKQIALAMHNYHDKYGCLPPACTVDKAGRPLHSWRVLLLPFLDWGALYQQIRLDEPYDSPHNRAVFDDIESGVNGPPSMPSVFWCPSDKEGHGDTNYVMIVGPRTISNGSNSICLKDITDGTSNTIAVVETYGLGIRWYEPRDLRVEEITFKINDPEYFGIASRHPGGAQVGLADGSVRFLPDTVDPRAVEAMTTVNGGEDVGKWLGER